MLPSCISISVFFSRFSLIKTKRQMPIPKLNYLLKKRRRTKSFFIAPLSNVYGYADFKLIKFKCDYHIFKNAPQHKQKHILLEYARRVCKHAQKLQNFLRIRYYQGAVFAFLVFASEAYLRKLLLEVSSQPRPFYTFLS